MQGRVQALAAISHDLRTPITRMRLRAEFVDDDASLRVRGKFTGKVGVLEGRWTDFRANTVSGDVSVLHVARTEATADAGK